MQIKLIFTRKVVHLASFWRWGFWNSEVAYCLKWETKDKLINPMSIASFSLLEWGSACIASSLRSHLSPKSSILFFLVKLAFSNTSICYNPMDITEPAVPSARLLGLCSKLYPSNVLRMLNKNLNCFVQSLSWASERQVLLAENYSLCTGVFLSLFFSFASKQEKRRAHKRARRYLKRKYRAYEQARKTTILSYLSNTFLDTSWIASGSKAFSPAIRDMTICWSCENV